MGRAQSPHPATSELPARSQLSPDKQNGFGTNRELQASQRQEVIWLAWNFIKLWVELHGGREGPQQKASIHWSGEIAERGKKEEQHPCVCGCQQEQSPQLFAIKNAECVHF